jgi:hypothetical protein
MALGGMTIDFPFGIYKNLSVYLPKTVLRVDPMRVSEQRRS